MVGLTTVLLGTGPWQFSMFSHLRSISSFVVTVSPGEKAFPSDLHICADVNDFNSIVSAMEQHTIRPNYFFTSQTDVAVKSVGRLNNHFSCRIPFNQSHNIFTNKPLVRELNRKSTTLKNPQFCVLETINLSENHLSQFDGPVVIKPVSLQSSLGVVSVKQANEFNFELYKDSLKNLNVGEVIVEGFIEGTEYTIEGYKFKGGQHKILAASKKDKSIGFGVANALVYSTKAMTEVSPIAEDLDLLFSSYDFGPTHTEVIVSEFGTYLVEAASRGGGSGIPSEIVPSLTGFFPEHQLIEDALGVRPPTAHIKKYPFVSLLFYASISDTFPSIKFDALGPNLIRSWTSYKAGDAVDKVVDDRSRHGFLILGSSGEEQQAHLLSVAKSDNLEISFYD